MRSSRGRSANQLVRFSTFRSVLETTPTEHEATFGELAAAMTQHVERSTKGGALIAPATYAGTRSNRNVLRISMLVADCDHVDVHHVHEILEATVFAYSLHTTSSHRPEDGRLRVLIPLAEPQEPTHWSAAFRAACTELHLPADLSCSDPSRAFYWPQCRPGAPRFAIWRDGEAYAMPRIAEATRSAPREPLPLPREAALDTYVQRAVEAELRDLARTLPGHQNVQLNRVAFKLAALLAGADRLDLETYITSTMIDIALGLPCSREPWTVRSAEAPIRSGWSAGLRHPRDLSHVGRDLAGGWL